MNFYLDTNIWIDYFDNKRAYHREAVKLLNKIKKLNGLILVTELHIYETSKCGYYEDYEKIKNLLYSKGLCKGVKISINERKKAKSLDEKMSYGVADYLHIVVGVREKAMMISNDKHWKKIGKIINYPVFTCSEALKLLNTKLI